MVPIPQHSGVTGSELVATGWKVVEGGGGCHCFFESSEQPAQDVAPACKCLWTTLSQENGA